MVKGTDHFGSQNFGIGLEIKFNSFEWDSSEVKRKNRTLIHTSNQTKIERLKNTLILHSLLIFNVHQWIRRQKIQNSRQIAERDNNNNNNNIYSDQILDSTLFLHFISI